MTAFFKGRLIYVELSFKGYSTRCYVIDLFSFDNFFLSKYLGATEHISNYLHSVITKMVGKPFCELIEH